MSQATYVSPATLEIQLCCSETLTGTLGNFSIACTANRYLGASYNGLLFTLTHFFLNILEFERQISIIAMVVYISIASLRHTCDVLKEFQQC